MKHTNARATAALILSKLRSGQGSLSTHFDALPSNDNEGLVRELCFGCCRFYQELDFLIGRLLGKPLRNKDADIACLMFAGIYQIRHLRIPDHAAVNETVAATGTLGKPWAAPLVNAVLRNYIKKQGELDAAIASAADFIRYSHPDWLLAAIKQDWPDGWEQILLANNCRPPMTLRVNLARMSRDSYLESLQSTHIEAFPGSLSNASVYLVKPCAVQDLPGFLAGLVSVQDEASQLVPGLMNLKSGLRVLDACAAPGGKTAHILESEQSLTKMLAVDASANRLIGVTENLSRLGLSADVRCGDAAKPEKWWDGIQFDRILLDAPCSATGVIRRHPDIKLLRHPGDLENLAQRQFQLLVALWPCLVPGGELLYTTCSVLRQENEAVIKAFLQQQTDAKYAAIAADWGVKCTFGRQLLPDREGSDGFYFCRVTKN
ncbi:MAG: 16S rRNA (cytosine(967)-C(5))-methyltransferase RsmB [Pseudohongiellaceae bacterium]